VVGVRVLRDGRPVTIGATVMVDARGDRFANQSESYVDLGHHDLSAAAATR